jgi:hypothetical protein
MYLVLRTVRSTYLTMVQYGVHPEVQYMYGVLDRYMVVLDHF